MKKFSAVCIGIGLMFIVTGCGNDVTLNTEQNDLVAEYIAGVMLKYSYENEWQYQKLAAAKSQNAEEEKKFGISNSTVNNTESKPTQPATENQTQGNAVSSDHVINAMKQALGLTDADISITAITSGQSYPEGQYVVSVPANNSCVVAAVEFEIANHSGADIVANTTSSGVAMKLGVEGTTITQSGSILKNDITGLKGVSIAPGQVYTACVVFQVPEVFADSLQDATLTIYNSGSSLGTVELKQ